MAGGAFSLAALGAALPVSTRGLAVASSSFSTAYPSSSSSSPAATSARPSFNVALIGRGRVLRAFGTSSSEPRASSRIIGFSSGTVFGAVSLRNLVWVGRQVDKKTGAGPSSSSPVFVTAAVATALEEAAAAPTVTTEVLPRPKKVGKGIVRLRLTRLGRKKRPFFRIVATHSSWRRDGKYIELLGHYDPLHAGTGIRVAIKPEYRVAHAVQLILPQNADVPRSLFTFDFELERKILAEAERESQGWGSRANGDAGSAPVSHQQSTRRAVSVLTAKLLGLSNYK